MDFSYLAQRGVLAAEDGGLSTFQKSARDISMCYVLILKVSLRRVQSTLKQSPSRCLKTYNFGDCVGRSAPSPSKER
jgi:hypothetical protein